MLPHTSPHSHIKILECHVIIGIGPLKDSLKDDKVIPGNETSFAAVCDAKQSRVLSASNFGQVVFRRDRIYELLYVQVSMQQVKGEYSVQRVNKMRTSGPP